MKVSAVEKTTGCFFILMGLLSVGSSIGVLYLMYLLIKALLKYLGA